MLPTSSPADFEYEPPCPDGQAKKISFWHSNAGLWKSGNCNASAAPMWPGFWHSEKSVLSGAIPETSGRPSKSPVHLHPGWRRMVLRRASIVHTQFGHNGRRSGGDTGFGRPLDPARKSRLANLASGKPVTEVTKIQSARATPAEPKRHAVGAEEH